MLIDTHCHLNFEAFRGTETKTLNQAYNKGVSKIIIPGTDVILSKRAVALTSKYPNVYATVGIHPHHTIKYQNSNIKYQTEIKTIEKLLHNKKVIGVGEVGLDRYEYQKTKYKDYQITDSFIQTQKKILIEQIKLAIKYNKALVLHNREATTDILRVLKKHWHPVLTRKVVFHCCEANEQLLEFATEHKIYIGVDGDITWSKKKQRFIAQVPIELLVLETDSPYLTPEPIRQVKEFPNVPANLPIIARMVASVKNINIEKISNQTIKNTQKLFNLA